jgi:hypothetical protein
MVLCLSIENENKVESSKRSANICKLDMVGASTPALDAPSVVLLNDHCCSLQVAVSFAHIVKSAEPVFSVILSGPLLGVTYPWYVWASLLPIVGGCSLSAMKEVSFSWGGFNNAMISNLGMVLRNIYSKKSLNDYKVGAGRV